MLLKVDFNFNYKYLFRQLFIQKFVEIHSSLFIPFFYKLLVYFSINELELWDDSRVYNYFYFFRFFFGSKCFFVSFKSFFSYSKTSYSFSLQGFFNKFRCFFPMFFLVNDLLFLSSDTYFYSFFNFEKLFLILRFFDLNLVAEKKTNLGLYYLYDNLNFKFFFRTKIFDADIFVFFFWFFKFWT